MSDLNPIVSICCVTYQHVNYIKDSLDGFLMQETNFPYEICLGEDESNDGTREICQEYAEKYPGKIKMFFRKRSNDPYIKQGFYGKYNFIKTLKECQGKYIALCDGDDYWTDPYKLQKQVDLLKESDGISMCYHKVIRPGTKLDEDTYLIKNDLSTAFIPTSSVVFRNKKEIVNKFINHSKGIISGDQFLFYLCSFIGEIKFMDFIGGVYNQTEHGISRTIGIQSKKWELNRILMYSSLLRISPFKNKVNLIKSAQSSLFNGMGYGIMKPFISYPFLG